MAFHVDSEVGVLKQVIVHALGRSALQRAPVMRLVDSRAWLRAKSAPELVVALHREPIRRH